MRQCLTCLIAVTVITKNKGRPLVTGLVGVSTITYWGKKKCNVNNKHMTFKLKSYALNTTKPPCSTCVFVVTEGGVCGNGTENWQPL